jgi:hypothetical protein
MNFVNFIENFAGNFNAQRDGPTALTGGRPTVALPTPLAHTRAAHCEKR